MAGLDSKIKIEISTIFNDNFSLLNLVDKNTAIIDFTLFMTFYSIAASIEEYRMRQDITNPFDIYKNRSISSHNMTIDIIVKGLRSFRLKDNLNFHFTL